MVDSLSENPRDSVNWRRHRNGCPKFRMRWYPHSNPDKGEPMYQVYCLMNTPPQTFDEQEKCLNSKTRCWRLAEAERKKRSSDRNEQSAQSAQSEREKETEAQIPVSSIKRRKPA